ncbi:MAG: hypothetical protein WC745_05460 [Patescibacteria group bacterium]|jgi:hypothetical protein
MRKNIKKKFAAKKRYFALKSATALMTAAMVVAPMGAALADSPDENSSDANGRRNGQSSVQTDSRTDSRMNADDNGMSGRPDFNRDKPGDRDNRRFDLSQRDNRDRLMKNPDLFRNNFDHLRRNPSIVKDNENFFRDFIRNNRRFVETNPDFLNIILDDDFDLVVRDPDLVNSFPELFFGNERFNARIIHFLNSHPRFFVNRPNFFVNHPRLFDMIASRPGLIRRLSRYAGFRRAFVRAFFGTHHDWQGWRDRSMNWGNEERDDG